MTVYFLDPAADFVDDTGDPDGDGSANVYTGPGGWEVAQTGTGNATALVAGDELRIQGGTGDANSTFNEQRYVDMTGLDAANGSDPAAWPIGEPVQNGDDDGGTPGAEWTGVIVFNDQVDGPDIVVQLDSPFDIGDVDIAEGIEAVTQVEVSGITAVALRPLTWTPTGDLVTGYIWLRGVDASWNTGLGASYAVLFDGQADGAGVQAAIGLTTSGGPDYVQMDNFHFANCSGDGFTTDGATIASWRMNYCKAYSNGGRGFDWNGDLLGGIVRNCIARDNTDSGFHNPSSGCRFVSSVASGNGTAGFGSHGAAGSIIQCLVYENTGDGIVLAADWVLISGCVIDGQGAGGSGVLIGANDTEILITGCRITNNANYGIEQTDADTSDTNVEDFNLFANNTTADLFRVTSGVHSYGDGANHIADPDVDGGPQGDGYVNAAGDHYEIVAGSYLSARNADDELELNWDGTPATNNSAWVTAGLAIEAPAGGGGGGVKLAGDGGGLVG